MHRLTKTFVLLIVFLLALGPVTFAQSRPQRSGKTGNEKKNQRPQDKTEAEIKAEEEKRREQLPPAPLIDDEILEIKTDIVNVDAVVYNKKTGDIITGLTKDNFAVFENGQKQEITNFSSPEAPITVSLVIEYSRWSEIFGYYGSSGRERGHLEVVRPVAYFLSRFVKPPDDYASVIAFDIRPTPITDFTNDPGRIRQTIDLLLRNRPAFRENNLFDALKFALLGGKADAVVLERSEERKADYGGMVDVQGKRRAIILVASGIDTFSKINLGDIRQIIQEAGIPIYAVSTGNMFYKKYEHRLPSMDGIDGSPGRLTFLQAQNQMNTFARESGGKHFPVTFPGEVPGVLQSINAMLRNQYSIAYNLGEKERKSGKKQKLEVKVDVNGDGKYDDKYYEVQHRPFYRTSEDDK